nr:MAG TPA: Short C-terminal domain [Caudoviricetes sp.]
MGANPQTINQYIAQLRQLDEELARGEISQEQYSQ